MISIFNENLCLALWGWASLGLSTFSPYSFSPSRHEAARLKLGGLASAVSASSGVHGGASLQSHFANSVWLQHFFVQIGGLIYIEFLDTKMAALLKLVALFSWTPWTCLRPALCDEMTVAGASSELLLLLLMMMMMTMMMKLTRDVFVSVCAWLCSRVWIVSCQWTLMDECCD